MIGFTTVTFREKTLEEIFEIAKLSGVDCIEMGGDVHLPYGDEVKISRVCELSGQYNIPILSYGSYYRVGENDLDKFTHIARTTKAIGAKIVRVWLGDKSSCLRSKKYVFTLVSELKTLADIAARYGLIVASEFHNKTFNDNYRACKRIIKEVAKPNYKTYWQPLGREKSDLKNLINILDDVVMVHTFNWLDFNTRYPFDYNISRWKKFISIVCSKDKNIPFVLEFVKDDNSEQFSKDIKTLKTILGEF